MKSKEVFEKDLERWNKEYTAPNLISNVLTNNYPIILFSFLKEDYPSLFFEPSQESVGDWNSLCDRWGLNPATAIFLRGVVCVQTPVPVQEWEGLTYSFKKNNQFYYYFLLNDDKDLPSITLSRISVYDSTSLLPYFSSGEGSTSLLYHMSIASLLSTLLTHSLLSQGEMSQVLNSLLPVKNVFFEVEYQRWSRLGADEKIKVREALIDYFVKSGRYKAFAQNTDSILGLYKWEGNVWKPYSSMIQKEIEEKIKSVGYITNTAFVQEIINKVQRKTITLLRYEKKLVSFNNIVFSWDEYLKGGGLLTSFHPPNPSYQIFNKIPHSIPLKDVGVVEALFSQSGLGVVAEKYCPHILHAFQDWVGKKYPLLFEIGGYVLYPNYTFNKAIMLFGEGKRGKSTFINFLNFLLGEENVSNIELQELIENRFLKAGLYHKLLNSYSDLPPTPLKRVGPFKTLTGEDFVTADRKNKSPIRFKNYAKLVFSANVLPKVPVSEWNQMAWWRRWLLVNFDSFNPDQAIPDFFEKTFSEGETGYFILLALLSFKRVFERKKFSFEEGVDSYREVWMRQTNPAYDFLRAGLLGETRPYGFVLVDSRGKPDVERVNTSVLFEKFCDFVVNVRDEPAPSSKKVLTRELLSEGFKVGFVHDGNSTSRAYVGLGLRFVNPEEESVLNNENDGGVRVDKVSVLFDFMGDKVLDYEVIKSFLSDKFGWGDDKCWGFVSDLVKKGDLLQVRPLVFQKIS